MKMVTVDVEKLYNIFDERGLTKSQVSRELGVNASYFANAKTRGTLNEMAVILLESKFMIPRESYVIEQPKEIVVETRSNEFVFTDELKKDLYQILYSAVYHALKQALNE